MLSVFIVGSVGYAVIRCLQYTPAQRIYFDFRPTSFKYRLSSVSIISLEFMVIYIEQWNYFNNLNNNYLNIMHPSQSIIRQMNRST